MLNGGSRSGQARPLYERHGDLLNEQRVTDFFSKKFGCTFSKLPIRYGLDYAISRSSKVTGFAEVKCRTNDVSRYDTYMLSMGKVMSGRNLTAVTSLPCFRMVQWTDAIGLLDLSSEGTVSIGGRLDRNDWQDTEPVIHYPIDSFRLFTSPA